MMKYNRIMMLFCLLGMMQAALGAGKGTDWSHKRILHKYHEYHRDGKKNKGDSHKVAAVSDKDIRLQERKRRLAQEQLRQALHVNPIILLEQFNHNMETYNIILPDDLIRVLYRNRLLISWILFVYMFKITYSDQENSCFYLCKSSYEG